MRRVSRQPAALRGLAGAGWDHPPLGLPPGPQRRRDPRWHHRGGHRYRCREIGSYARAQELLRQGHTDLDGNGNEEACESLRSLGFCRYGNRHSSGPPPAEKGRTLKLRGDPGANPILALQQSPARDHLSRCAQRRCANDATHNSELGDAARASSRSHRERYASSVSRVLKPRAAVPGPGSQPRRSSPEHLFPET